MEPPDDDIAIRNAYAREGVEAFYRRAGSTYRNPHEPAIEQVLRRSVDRWNPDLSHVLDLAAGSGEVTLVLRDLGAQRLEACDPYTFEAYRARTGQPAETWTFEQIASGILADRQYSLIVCSFALHLCEESRLPSVAMALSRATRQMIILTPHKRPEIREQWGWRLDDELLAHRVRARRYCSTSAPDALE